MSHASRAHTVIAAAALAVAGAHAARAQAAVPPPPPAAAVPVLIQPPAAVIPPRRAPALRASTSTTSLPTLTLAPRRSARPDSLPRAARIALATPTPLTAPTPTRRIREFGPVRNDVARQAAPGGATGRCKDGTFLLGTPSEEACAGKGGLFVRMARPPTPPVAPSRRP